MKLQTLSFSLSFPLSSISIAIYGLQLVPKLTLPLMEEVEKVLDNKPALRRLHQSSSVINASGEAIGDAAETATSV